MMSRTIAIAMFGIGLGLACAAVGCGSKETPPSQPSVSLTPDDKGDGKDNPTPPAAVIRPTYELDPAKHLIPTGLVSGILAGEVVTAEARLEVAVPPDLTALPPDLTAALARGPHTDQQRAPSDPSLKSASAVLTGAAPSLTFDIATGSAGTAAELFVEATDGVYLPIARKVGEPTAGVQRFRINLEGIDELAALKGRTLRLTVATHSGGAETSWVVR